MLELQSRFDHTSIDFFHRQLGYEYVQVPQITNLISSPMGLSSDSLPDHIPLHGQEICPADSMQFTLEYALRLKARLKGAYYIDCSFRGEVHGKTHLNQFYHIECELLGDMNDDIRVAEQYIMNMASVLLEDQQDLNSENSGWYRAPLPVHSDKATERDQRMRPDTVDREKLDPVPDSVNPLLAAHEVTNSLPATSITLTDTRDSSDGSTVSEKFSFHTPIVPCNREISCTLERAGCPRSSSASTPPSNAPPPFSAHNFSPEESANRIKLSGPEPDSCPPPPFTPAYPAEPQQTPESELELATEAGLAATKEAESSVRSAEEKEPPPPYTEGPSPLGSFTYLMAAAGGPASIITQVPQGGPPPREGHTIAGMKWQRYDPASLQYMLDFFRTVAQTIPSSSPSPTTDTPSTDTTMQGSARDMLQDRAGIIVLREDLDFYAIPPRAEIDQPEMIEVKRAAGRALLKQDGIFSGLRKSEEAGTTEQHLIEMLTAGGFYNDDRWGHRASEPNKAVICSLALARLRTDIKGNDLANSNAVGMAQKLLLFWRKPARRCWWEGVELENVDGIDGKLKVWIRRVWTLEMAFEDLASRKLHILRQLADLSSPSKIIQPRSDKCREMTKEETLNLNPRQLRPRDTGRRYPHPDAQSVLDGLPPPPPGRRRRVPSMVNANHIPFLRFKKPQPPFLTHMICKKTDERNKRIDSMQRLEKILLLAEDEDQWDRILEHMHGNLSSNENETQWATATSEALFHVKQVHKNNIMKRYYMAQRMFEIVQKEKRLAEQERLMRRDQRHQVYKTRRRLKEAAEQIPFSKDTTIASAGAI
ncbi:MAG: hypothetical protein Q9223_002548 [Gallowayella weberi]